MSQPKLKQYQKPRRRPFRWQPLLLALGGVLLIGASFFALRKEPAPGPASTSDIAVSGAPRLTVDQELVDLGDVKLNQLVQVSFTLSNTGDQPLKFSKAPYVEVVEGC